jgi:hypothetical protein
MTLPKPLKLDPRLTDEVLRRLSEALQGLHFGALEITLHDGRIVQIERREKLRLRD